MAHARIIQQQMLDWIKNSLSLRSALPTDAQIVDRFNLNGVESARSLLADLADAGEITIKGFGASRTMVLGRKAKTLEPAARPTPSVVARIGGKRADDEKVQIEATTARIREIIERGRSTVAEPAPIADDIAQVEPALPPVAMQPAPSTVSPVSFDSESEPPSPAAPEPTATEVQPTLEIERLPTAPGRSVARSETAVASRETRRQLNIHFPHDQFEKLTVIANGEGTSAAAYARATLISCLDRKPRVPAAVTAAALREKTPVVDFADRMMALGLAAYDHERAGSAAQ